MARAIIINQDGSTEGMTHFVMDDLHRFLEVEAWERLPPRVPKSVQEHRVSVEIIDANFV